jgi:hypothetical protein
LNARASSAASVLAALILVALTACGGGGQLSGTGGSTGTSGGTSGTNVQAITVNLGPTGNYVNGLFTTVTVCGTGTSNCQTINNILVDTGSYGLRLLGSVLTLPLTTQTNSGGASIGECAVFADGYSWGPVQKADLQVAGEVASGIPIHVIGAANFAPAPAACSNGAGTAENTVAAFGANGVLGIGPLAQDCGATCTSFANNNIYFACTGTVCTSTTESLVNQVQNPVPYFAGDNNGVIIQLPSVSPSGQVTASGSLIFGIGTQTNNGLGSAQILTADSNAEFSTTFQGTTTSAFIDSGSNALYFASTLPTCSSETYFYCPSSLQNFTAQMIGVSGTTVTVPFSVINAQALPSTFAAVNDLAGPTGSGLNGFFDWGVPFLYGRNVYFAIEGRVTPGGTGPYFAF